MRDDITAMALDNAVLTFGLWIENTLEERDDEGNRIHTLPELLDIELSLEDQLRRNSQQFQAILPVLRGGMV